MGNRIHTEVIHYWQQKNIEVELLCFEARAERETHEMLDDIPVYRYPIGRTLQQRTFNRIAEPLFHYPFFAGLFNAYYRFIKSRTYDFVHVETAFPLGVVASLLPRDLHPPMAVTLPGADVMAQPAFDYGYARFASVRRLLKLVWRRAALVRGDSRYIQRRAIELGCPPEKAVAVPYNISDGDFPPVGWPLSEIKTAAREAIMQQHDLEPGTQIVLSLSRLHPFKGVEFLVKAAPAVLAAAPNTMFLIAGPRRNTQRFGDYAGYLEGLISDLGIADRVRLIGGLPHDDVPRYLAGSDAVVVPSVLEALNRVAIEAAAFSTPAVVTRTTGISEYMVEHGYGLVVEPQSPDAIAAALRILLREPQRQRALGARGPELAARFRSSLIAEELLSHYQAALGGGGMPAEQPTYLEAR
jgi:glycosyltransferase involved in cell wall biosynthesis